MTPVEFSSVFDRIMTRRAQEVARNWEKNQKFTEFLLGEENPKGVCREVADIFGLQYCREYWRSDAVMFERLNEKHFSPGDIYAEHLSVAIEVENNPWSAKDEVSKLMTLDTPLRVLVTYPSRKCPSCRCGRKLSARPTGHLMPRRFVASLWFSAFWRRQNPDGST
jgi:hypothetical protein